MTAARRGLLAVALLAALTGLPSLAPGFIHDDHRIVEQNELIRDLRHVPEILTRGYWTVDANAVPNLYRPVTILSFAANHAAGGLHPLGFRVVDLLLHALAAVLVALLARRACGLAGPGSGPIDPALAAGLLFAVHPIHTEALGLVVGRSEILAAIGAVGAVLLFLDARDRRASGDAGGARARQALALVSFAFGFLAKENAVVTPLLVLAADLLLPPGPSPAAAGPVRVPLRGPAWRAHAGFALVLAGLVLLRTAVLGAVGPGAFTHFIDNPIAHEPFPRSTFTALAVAARYARLLIVPAPLAIDYSYDAIAPSRSALDPAVLAGGAVVAAVAAAAWRLRRRRPAGSFALVFLALAFAPVSNLVVPIGTIMAERLLYLPSAGFALLAGAWAARFAMGSAARARVARAAGALVLLVLGGMSVARLLDWKDDRTLFARAIAVQPRSVRAQFNYGVASEAAGDDGAAQRAYDAALAIWPAFADAQYNLAGVLMRGAHVEAAMAHYREAARLEPGNVMYLVNLGNALQRAGRPAEAAEILERAAALDASSHRAWNNLGVARLALGRPVEAALAWRKAAAIEPANPEYAMNLALALDAANDPEAVAAWGTAAGLRPGDGLIRYRLGRALERAARPEEAAAAYRESARLSPASPVPLRALGLLLAGRGEREAARAALERAAALDREGTVMDAEARAVLESLGR